MLRAPGKAGSTDSSLLIVSDGTKAFAEDEREQERARGRGRQQERALLHKLSSSSLSMSLPPDSPPAMFDDLPDVQGGGDDCLMQQRQRRGTATDEDETENMDAHSQTRPISTLSWMPWQPAHLAHTSQSSLAPAHARAWTGSELDTPGTCAGNDKNDSDHDTDEASSSGYKSRHQLEIMLANADKVIRDKERELSLLTVAGEGLLQEYTSLKHRHENLLSTSAVAGGLTHPPSKSSDLSIASSPRASTSSAELTNYPAPSPARQPRMPAGPSYGSPPSAASKPSPTPASFETDSQLRPLTPSPRDRTSAFIGSSPRTRVRRATSSPLEVQSLSQANYQLSVQLSEIEADSERAERQGRKRLRKLERELAALRHELERVEERNTVLEEAVATSSSLGSSGSQAGMLWSRSRGVEDGEKTPTLFDAYRDKQPGEHFKNQACAPVSRAGLQLCVPVTPTTTSPARRQPGNGTPQVPIASPSRSSQYVEQHNNGRSTQSFEVNEELVSQLLAKIEELRITNDSIADEKIEMSKRLEQATRDVDEFKRRCEEMEDALFIGWEDQRGRIEWPEQANSDISPNQGRPKGNQRDIQRKSRHCRSGSMPLSSSLGSINSIASLTAPVCRKSPSPVSHRRKPSKGGRRPRQPPRTLSSELGSELPQATFEREPVELSDDCSYGYHEHFTDNPRYFGGDLSCHTSSDEEDVNEPGVRPSSGAATNSTSTPTKDNRRQTHHRQRLSGGRHRRRFSDLPSNVESFVTGSVYADLDTAQDVVPVGSLKHSGPPDADSYEKLANVVGDLPAVWEDEDDLDPFQVGPSSLLLPVGVNAGHSRRKSGVKGVRSGWVPRSVIQTLEWKQTEDDDDETYWSRYPEEEDEQDRDAKRIESREMVDEREMQERRARRKTRQKRRRRLDAKGKARAGDNIDEADTPMSRREHALRRLGLDTLPDFHSRFDRHAAYGNLTYSGNSGDEDDHESRAYDSDYSGSSWTRSYDEEDYDYSDDSHETSSSFSHLSDTAVTCARQRNKRDNTFYPLTLRARYAPKMVVSRLTDSAVKHLFMLVTYVRFFVVLGMALSWALWQ
ncbi:hypothetical protein OIV83_006081 [Microbotryomycetes sp. JL201]|nr:hypothetical protein OIV83_006081 [Microbotryomycetes sp. JL201]